MDYLDKIINVNCLEGLKLLPDNSVNCVVTSPPYWALRDYGEDVEVLWGDGWRGQLGLEVDFNQYIGHLVEIFDEVKRVLRKEGTCWVVIGDTYSGNKEVKTDKKVSDYLKDISKGIHKKATISEKSLCQIPSRLSIEMCNHGWILRNVIIWHKPNSIPSSVRDRFTVDFEYVFFFVKSRRYYFEQQFESCVDGSDVEYRKELRKNKVYNVKDPYVNNVPYCNNKSVRKTKYDEGSGHSNRQGLNKKLDVVTVKAYMEYQKPIALYLKKHIRAEHRKVLDKVFGQHCWRHWIRTDLSGASLPSPEAWFKLKEIIGFDDTFDDKIYEVQKLNIPVLTDKRNKRCVWSVNTEAFKDSHFAVFPEKLIVPMIKAGCPEGGVVLDPFMGAGTTAVVAKKLGRHFIGFEANKSYIDIAKKRLINEYGLFLNIE